MQHTGVAMVLRPISIYFLALFATAWASPQAEPEYRNMGPDIFDRQVRGEELVEKAVARAKTDHKRIVLLFGANWCPWCRRLHRAFTEDPAVQAALQRNFILVFIDANTRNDKLRNVATIERFGNPLRLGLPALVVLDQDGVQLTTQETASLAAPTDEEVGKRVMAFLMTWVPRAN